jgi:hypothetical protein
LSGESSTTERKASANEIAYAILNGTCIPGSKSTTTVRLTRHMRHVSAPDTAQGAHYNDRMDKGWKPNLKNPHEPSTSNTTMILKSSSAHLLSRFSPDTSPDDDKVNLLEAFEKDLDSRLAGEKFLPVRKIRSADPLRYSSSPPNALTNVARRVSAANTVARNSEESAGAQTEYQLRRRMFEEVKNKPLPKIAIL